MTLLAVLLDSFALDAQLVLLGQLVVLQLTSGLFEVLDLLTTGLLELLGILLKLVKLLLLVLESLVQVLHALA